MKEVLTLSSSFVAHWKPRRALTGPQRERVERIIAAWKISGAPDARAALAAHPELAAEPQAVLDLAVEEYCQRAYQGAAPDKNAFVEAFPGLAQTLRKVLHTASLLARDPELAGGVEQLASLSQIEAPNVGDTYFDCQILHDIGRGAFARVYLAAQPELGGRRVVLKVSDDSPAEARTQGRFAHRNIVAVHWVARDERGRTVVCMPYTGTATLHRLMNRISERRRLPATGAELLALIREESLPSEPVAGLSEPHPAFSRGSFADAAAFLVAQAADALAHLHANGVLHRDLKPANVLLAPDGTVRLMDFNLAAESEQDVQLCGGTLPYMAPEQLDDFLAATDSVLDDVGTAADVYALGVLLYELLANWHPFGAVNENVPADDMARILLDKQREGYRPLEAVNPSVSPRLAALVDRCLALDPKSRPLADELATQLRQCLPSREPARTRRGARPWVGLAALLLLAFLSGMPGLFPPAASTEQIVAQGRAAFERGDYLRAVRLFSEALLAEPDNAALYFARGRAHQRLGQLGSAVIDFSRANELVPDGRAWACLGDCFSREQRHDQAIHCYEEAIKAGHGPAAVYNNLGYALSQLSPPDWTRAKKCFDQAIQLDPTLQAAYHNRAAADLHTALANRKHVPETGLQDAEKALALGPPSAELHRDAAYLAALLVANGKQGRRVESALNHLDKAINLGADPKEFTGSKVFACFANNEHFRKIIGQPPCPTPPRPSQHLVELGGEPLR